MGRAMQALLASWADAAQGWREGRSAAGTDLGEGALGEDAADGRVSWWAKADAAKGEGGVGTYMSRQVFPQAPSPTITSLRRISAMMVLCGAEDGSSGKGSGRAAAEADGG